jgi:transposase
MVVREYKEGKLGIRSLAKKYGIKSKSPQLGLWINLYEEFGVEGLKRRNGKGNYSVPFKLMY